MSDRTDFSLQLHIKLSESNIRDKRNQLFFLCTFVCLVFFKCKLTHTKLICFRCVVMNKNNILFLFYMLYKFGRACSHSELMKKKLMKQNKQIFFKFPFYFSPKHDLIDDSVLNRLDDKSSYYTERFYLESHVNFFQKSIFRLPVLD